MTEMEYRWAPAGETPPVPWSGWQTLTDFVHFGPMPGGLLFETRPRPKWAGPGWYAPPEPDGDKPTQLHWYSDEDGALRPPDGWIRYSSIRHAGGHW